MKFKKGDIAWVHDSDAGWVRVEIIKVRGNYYNVRRTDRAAAFGASGHRLLSQEEYEHKMTLEYQQQNLLPNPERPTISPHIYTKHNSDCL